MPKRKGRGRPKGSTAQKKLKESFDDEFVILRIPPEVLEVDPGFGEEQEAGTSTPKKRGRGRPKRSTAQNYQDRFHSNLNYQTNLLNMVEDVPQYEDSEDTGMDTNAVDTPTESGKGLPRGLASERNQQQTTNDTSFKPIRKGRGQTRGLTVQMKRLRSADGKLDVSIDPTRLVAVGPGRNDFITDLAVIVRRNARLNVHEWRKVPKSTKNTIVENILKNWRLQDTDMVRKAILNEAKCLYRRWRNKFHRYYLMFETKEEALKHVPVDINDSDWKFMVDYFSSPSYEIKCAKNKASKAKQQTHHTSGSKSYQAISYDALDPVTGKEPDLQTLWQLTHKKATGEWVDEASKEINDKVAEQINEKLCEFEDSQDGTKTIEPEIINAAFKTVVGKKSYREGIGSGPRSSGSDTIQQLQVELDAQKREINNARKEFNEIRVTLVEVKSQLEEERRKREKEKQEIVSQVQSAIHSALSQYCLQTNEAETSAKHKRIAELEAQLNEAEEVISDIRSELIRYRGF